MQVSKLAAVALAALLVTAGAAVAAPGDAPANEHADDHEEATAHDDDHEEAAADGDTHGQDAENASEHAAENASATAENASEHAVADGAPMAESADEQAAGAAAAGTPAGSSENAAAQAAGQSNAERGPPAELPDQAAAHVDQVHDLVRQFLGGDLDGSLGEHVGALVTGENVEA